MPAVTVTAARNANRCGGAGSRIGCCLVAQAGLSIGRQWHDDGGSAGLVMTTLVWLRWQQRRLWKPRARLWRVAESGCTGLGTGRGFQKAGEGRR